MPINLNWDCYDSGLCLQEAVPSLLVEFQLTRQQVLSLLLLIVSSAHRLIIYVDNRFVKEKWQKITDLSFSNVRTFCF